MEFLYMRKTSSLKLAFTSLISTLLICLSGCEGTTSTNGPQLNTKANLSPAPLTIDILATGKSDCIIIQIQDKTVMIDTGLDENGETITDFLKKENIDTIDYLIISHLDKDHIGGADIILDEGIEVQNVIQPNYSRDTKQHKEYVKALEKHDIKPTLLTSDTVLEVNGATIIVSAPLREEYEQSNDYSLITSLSYKNQSFLFAGDAEAIRISEFLASNPHAYTLLKVPHHGKYSDNLEELLQMTTPDYGIITCSEDEYPDQQVLDLLTKYQVQTLLTSDGPIIIRSDGQQITVNQQLTSTLSLKQKGD